MILTGRQFFQQHIFGKIDSNVKIEEIISSGANYEIQVCNPKWMRSGSKFMDVRGVVWMVSEIDYDTNVVTCVRLTNTAVLNRLETIVIDSPVFKSGTPRNLTKEEALALTGGASSATMFIWLLETISGNDPIKTENGGSDFDYTFYILFSTDYPSTTNEQRHNHGIIQATQLRAELKRIMDETNGIFRLTKMDWKEFNYFGRENESGMESFILNANLSGIECRVSVRATRKLICKC